MIDHLNFSATVFAMAIICWFIQMLTSLLYGKNCRHDISAIVSLVPCSLLFLAAASAWNQPPVHFVASPVFSFAGASLTQRIDQLACIFLALISIVGASTSVFSISYLSHLKDRIHSGYYWSALSMFMLSMSMLVVSDNALVFLVFWESMALASFALVAAEHKQHDVQRASMVYLIATRIATAFLMAGFVWMQSVCHSWDFSAWSFSGANAIPALLIAIGLSIKSGLWPFHLWLPYAHTAAPSPVSALMSAVMIKLSLYAAIRVLLLAGSDSLLVAGLFLGLGLVSAFWGLLFALVQQDLKRLLAYSSIENLGIIFCGLGLALLAHRLHIDDAASLALTACIFHSVNHGIFKSLLFIGVGSIDASAHSRDLTKLGGLAKKLPFTMCCFVVGTAAICSLPPMNGFASKYLLYSGLFHQAFLSPQLFVRALCIAWIGTLALVSGLSIFCFSRAVGISFLGSPRSSSAEKAVEMGLACRVAQAMLATLCVVLGLLSPVLAQQIQAVANSALALPPPQFSPFPIPMAQLFVFFLLAFLAVRVLLLKSSKTRQFDTWDCGFGSSTARMQASSMSFTQPIARIFSPILRFKLLVEIKGQDRRHFPDFVKVDPQIVSILETRVYLPMLNLLRKLAENLAKLQAGSIHLYLLYLCITLVVLIVVGTKI